MQKLTETMASIGFIVLEIAVGGSGCHCSCLTAEVENLGTLERSHWLGKIQCHLIHLMTDRKVLPPIAYGRACYQIELAETSKTSNHHHTFAVV